jgi:hypothetical protein
MSKNPPSQLIEANRTVIEPCLASPNEAFLDTSPNGAELGTCTVSLLVQRQMLKMQKPQNCETRRPGSYDSGG